MPDSILQPVIFCGDRIFVCNEVRRFLFAWRLQEISVPARIIFEPKGRYGRKRTHTQDEERTSVHDKSRQKLVSESAPTVD